MDTPAPVPATTADPFTQPPTASPMSVSPVSVSPMAASMATSLPAPPPPLSQRQARRERPRPGQLSGGWANAFWFTWAGVAGSWAAVWASSRTTGLSTWWLGPEADPANLLLNLLPFVMPLGLAVAGLSRARHLPWWGMAGAVAQGAIAVGDLGGPGNYGLIELAVAAGAFVVSVASLGGMYRRGSLAS